VTRDKWTRVRVSPTAKGKYGPSQLSHARKPAFVTKHQNNFVMVEMLRSWGGNRRFGVALDLRCVQTL